MDESGTSFKATIGARRHEISAATIACHELFYVSDEVAIQIDSSGRLHAGTLTVSFYDRESRPCSRAEWEGLGYKVGEPVELSYVPQHHHWPQWPTITKGA
jgi:hypothetical protein